jgi:putative lipoprotein
VLDPGGGVSARIDERAVQPSGGQATTTATISGPPDTEFATKSGAAGDVDCIDSAGYGDVQHLTDTHVVAVTVSAVDGIYFFCVAEPGREQFAATSVIQVDSTPPIVDPDLSIVDVGDALFVEPIFAVPELSDYRLKVGPDAQIDCADEDGYIRYRRIPVEVPTSDLPVAVCVIGSDEAGNEAAPYRQLIEAEAAPTLEVSGVVSYRERMALPEDAVVIVRVEDVSIADAPAVTIAEQVIVPTRQVPIPFSLTIDPTVLEERRRYAVRAEIRVDDVLLWVTDTVVPVSSSEPTTDLELVLVRVRG